MRGCRVFLFGGAVFIAFVAAGPSAESAPVTYVSSSAPSCGGLAPCYSNMAAAIQNVDNGGSVVVLTSMADNIFDTFSKVGITVRGNTPTIAINGGVNVGPSSVMTGWTIRDLQFNNVVAITNIATSLNIRNISTTGIQLGFFTQNPNAAIDIRGVTFPGGPSALISILGSNGVDIGGTITIADNINAWAVNIFTFVGAGDPASLTAHIAIVANQISKGANIAVNSDGTVGTGNITGHIQILDNVSSPLDGALGAIINGNASGNITGPITFTGNDAQALVVATADSAIGGTIGPVTFTGNDVEAIEINGKGAALLGPVFVSGNNVVAKGGPASASPYIQVDGMPVAAAVTVQNTTGGEALISTSSSVSGHYSGPIRITGNTVRRMIIDSRSGSITRPVTITGNVLPVLPNPDSTLTIRTLAGGSFAGGTIAANSVDGIQFDLAGGLSGALSISANTVGELTSLINSGPVGPGTNTIQGNRLSGQTYLQGITTIKRFNNIGGTASYVAGPFVDARYNWWGCNRGPGLAPCVTGTGSVPVFPWLRFNAETRCTSATSAVQTVDLLVASDGSRPAGNITPATAVITTTQGSVNPPSLAFAGSGTATVTLPSPATPTITSRVDSASAAWPAACSPDPTTVGLYVPSGGTFALRNRNATGNADLAFTFGVPNQKPLMGDWNGDGAETPGVYDPASSQFFLRNNNNVGFADIAFAFGPGGGGWLPLIGDWNGDGVDTVGLYVPQNSQFLLRNSNTGGFAEIVVGFGPGGAGWLPIVGDWNGDGVDTVGLYNPVSSQFFLRNSNTSGNAELTPGFGPGGGGWLPIVGDWDGDGDDTIGLYRPSQSDLFLRNSNTTGVAEIYFAYGPGGAGWLPFTGDFDGPF